jgi:glutathione S-transferase
MVTLYYSPGACSLAPHIVLEESGKPFEARKVALADGENWKPEFLAVNPTGFVPALVVEGEVITENLAVLTYLGTRYPELALLPLDQPRALARCYKQMAFLSASLHIAYAQLWRPQRFTPDESAHPQIVKGGRERIIRYNSDIDRQLAQSKYFAGNEITLADPYLFVFFRWGNRIDVDMDFPHWQAHSQRMLARPAVQRTLKREGLDPGDFLTKT